MDYLVYKITNTINNKIYVGKTKEYYGEEYFGIEGRLRNHLVCAFTKSKKNDCPKFYNAIKKYGKDKFKIELVEKTTESEINNKETYYIDLYKSTNDEFGYNIALGGGGRSVVNVNDEIREKISKSQSNNGMLNIKPYYNKNNIQTGYTARRRENGKIYQKLFSDTQFTVEENLNNAKNYIDSIKENKIDNSIKYNRSNDLPTNICCIKDKINKSQIIGYRVDILCNGLMIRKSFQSKTTDLKILLDNATKFRDEKLNNVK